jgi:hypothetical protein
MRFALYNQHVGAALLSEVIGHAGSNDATTDDYDVCCFGHVVAKKFRL